VSAVRFLFDEDFNGRIVRGFRRRRPNAGSRTARELGLTSADDPVVLDRAASDERLLVSHDRRTMSVAARQRIRQRLPMFGVILVRQDYPIAAAIDDLVLISEVTTAEEWLDVVAFLPL